MACAYDADAANLPFAVLRSHVGSLSDVNGAMCHIDCPFTGERLTAVPSLRPDVAVIHAQRADREGNVLIEGILAAYRSRRCSPHDAPWSPLKSRSSASTTCTQTRAFCPTGRSPQSMTVSAARLLNSGHVCLVGIGLPSVACNLARLTHAPGITLVYESGTIGARPTVLPLSVGERLVSKRTLELGAGEVATTAARLIATASLLSWLLVLYWGRMIAFIGDAF